MPRQPNRPRAAFQPSPLHLLTAVLLAPLLLACGPETRAQALPLAEVHAADDWSAAIVEA